MAELVHIDVVGPVTPKAYDGSLWYIVFTDDLTRWRYVCNMKTKGQAKDEIGRFLNMLFTQMDLRIARVRLDNGKEFGGGPIIEWLRSLGITYETTVPYGPEQNGVAERSNGLLAAKARAMILDSGVSETLWPEAVRTACYLLNRLPTSALEDNKVPIQLLFESLNKDRSADPIDLRHLRCFGCTAYVHIPKEIRTTGAKFEPRSNKGILVGYEGRNQYRVWLPEKGKAGRVVRARDVQFDEGPLIYDVEVAVPIPRVTQPHTVSAGQGGVQLPTLSPSQLPPLPPSPEYVSPYPPIPVSPNQLEEMEEEEEDVTDIPPTIDRPVPAEPRRSGRERRPPTKLGLEAIMAYPAVFDAIVDAMEKKEDSGGEPQTFKQAIGSHESKDWKKAMDSEYNSLMANSTWTLEALPPDRRALKGKWIYRYKRGPDGSILRHKARWVVKGFEQRFGIDYKETFATVVKSMTYKVIFAIAAFYDYELEQMDVKTAFLHGDLEEEIYVVQPNGYEKEKGKVCKLKKALYGLKQSPRLWYEVMHRFLDSLGYTRIHADNSVFRNGTLFVAVYVDDILICGPDKDEILGLKAKLSDHFEMTDCRACKHYLGMLVTRNRTLRTLTLSQETYLTGVLKDFGLQDAKAVTTPMEPGVYLTKATGTAEPGLITQYQKAIGSLMYAMTQTRPDIAYAVSTLSQFAHNPNDTHWKALKRVFRYVRGTLDVVLEYKSGDQLELLGYSDSDWGGDLGSRRSTSGYVFKMANGPVSWS